MDSTQIEPAELDRLASELYNACPSPKPSWQQLGDVTKTVWREYVQAGVKPADYAPPESK